MKDDIYQTPKADVAQERPLPDAVDQHLGLRWGRGQYIVTCFGFIFFFFFAVGILAIIEVPFLDWLVPLAFGGILSYLSAYRFRDCNISGWWGLIVMTPLLNFLSLVILACIPGTPGSNRYGYPT